MGPYPTNECPFKPLPKRGRARLSERCPERQCPFCEQYVINGKGYWVCDPTWRELRKAS